MEAGTCKLRLTASRMRIARGVCAKTPHLYQRPTSAARQRRSHRGDPGNLIPTGAHSHLSPASFIRPRIMN